MFEEKLFDGPNAHPAASVERRSDGVIFLRSTERLGPFARCTTDHLVYWGQREPQRRFLAKRGSSGEWQIITYGEALDRVSRIGQSLLNRGLSHDRPIAILSG